ncbi:hypothetical protein AAEX28_03185 [Lentisphaerota bacterium WC36G]|nr:hypothetical protein LJT99_06060 [Lentisphaerae bacterium WC36]
MLNYKCSVKFRRRIIFRLVSFIIAFFLCNGLLAIDKAVREKDNTRQNNQSIFIFDDRVAKIDLALKNDSEKSIPLKWCLVDENQRIIAASENVIKPKQQKITVVIEVPKLKKGVVFHAILKYEYNNKKNKKNITLIEESSLKETCFRKLELVIEEQSEFKKYAKSIERFGGKVVYNINKKQLKKNNILYVLNSKNFRDEIENNFVEQLLKKGYNVLLIAESEFRISLSNDKIKNMSLNNKYIMGVSNLLLRKNINLLQNNLQSRQKKEILIDINANSDSDKKINIFGVYKKNIKNKRSFKFLKIKFFNNNLFILNYNILKELKSNPLATLLLKEMGDKNEEQNF